MQNMQNISNKKYKKLRNYGSKMKELTDFALEKGCFIPVIGHLFLTKRHSDNPEAEVYVKPPQSEVIFEEKVNLN